MTSKKSEDKKAEEQDAEVLTEAQTPMNPIGDQGIRANYDPTGQIVQPGEPLHSTDPEEQAAYELERREAIRRSQMGEDLPAEEEPEQEPESS